VSLDLTTQMVILGVILAVIALLLQIIRKTLLPRSTVLAGSAAVIVTVFMGQVATWYVDALPTPSIPVVLFSGFVGLFAAQPEMWRVSGLCRALALVSLMIVVWAITTQNLVESSLSLLATGALLYLSQLASRSEASH
jgi:hypothetical protein